MFTKTVEHEPERAVRRESIARVVERAVVQQPQEKVEEAAASVVLGRLHEGPKSKSPLSRPGRHTALAGLPPDPVNGAGGTAGS